MERWLASHDRRLEEVEAVVDDLRLRVQGPRELISEERLGPGPSLGCVGDGRLSSAALPLAGLEIGPVQ
jgi:hypothetical protein